MHILRVNDNLRKVLVMTEIDKFRYVGHLEYQRELLIQALAAAWTKWAPSELREQVTVPATTHMIVERLGVLDDIPDYRIGDLDEGTNADGDVRDRPAESRNDQTPKAQKPKRARHNSVEDSDSSLSAPSVGSTTTAGYSRGYLEAAMPGGSNCRSDASSDITSFAPPVIRQALDKYRPQQSEGGCFEQYANLMDESISNYDHRMLLPEYVWNEGYAGTSRVSQTLSQSAIYRDVTVPMLSRYESGHWGHYLNEG